MLTLDQVNRIKRLHSNGVSNRRITAKTGHSTKTVYEVLSGRWSPKRSSSARQSQRCPGCGAKVFGDCLACRLRNNQISRAA